MVIWCRFAVNAEGMICFQRFIISEEIGYGGFEVVKLWKLAIVLVIAVMSIAGGSVVCAAGKYVETELNGLKITIDSNTGSILEMSYPGVGSILKADPDKASTVDVAYPLKPFEAMRLASRFSTGAKIEKTADSVTITWDELGMSRKIDFSQKNSLGHRLVYSEKTSQYTWEPVPTSEYDMGGKVSAKVVLKAHPDGKSIIMTCTIDNKSKHSIMQTMFPDFFGLLPIAGKDNTYFRACGVNSKPFVQVNRSDRGCAFYATDLGLNGVENVPGAYFGTTLMIGQYYDFGGLNGGFSIYRKKWGWEPEDIPWTNRQSIWIRKSEEDGKLRIMWANKAEIKPGQTWQSAEFVLTPHNGGWARGIDSYRDWVRSNTAKRKYPMPKHIKEGLGFRTVFMTTGTYPGDPDPNRFTIWKIKDLPKVAKEAKECGLTELVVWWWQQHLQLPGSPPYPQCGTEQELHDAIAECKKMGVNVNLFVSFYSLGEQSAARYNITVPKEGGWTYDPDLIPLFNPGYATYSNTGGADLNNPAWRKDVLASCKNIIDKYTPSIAWDQWADYSADSGIYSLTAEIRRMAKEKDPESTFSGESFSSIESEALYLDYFWSWGSYGMWGDLQAFSSTFDAPRPNPNVDISAVDVKYCFMDNLFMNIMPRRATSINGSAYISEFPELLKTLKSCAKLRKTFLPYFVNGKLIGYCFMSKDCPGAHFNAYVMPDRMLVIAIKEGGEGTIDMDCDLAPWLSSSTGKYTVKGYNENGKLITKTILSSPKSRISTGKLGLNELAIYEITPESVK